jgi:competence protein ComEC
MKNNLQKKIIYFGVVAVIFVVLFSYGAWQESRQQKLQVTFFDVGQGDSVLIQTPSHQTILIDGGPDSGVLDKLGRALPFYDHTIDLVVLTHAHADHLDGLIPVMERYRVERVLYNGVPATTPDYIEWQNIITEKNISMTIAQANQVFRFGEVDLGVLYPVGDINHNSFKDLNASSVVTRLVYQNTSFLFTGDAPVDVEKQILKNNTDVKSDVLKVGHHGSKYSSSEEFLQAVQPKFAVIQVGAGNKFGHPHTITLQKLKQIKAAVFRTDKDGDIKISSDGLLINIE